MHDDIATCENIIIGAWTEDGQTIAKVGRLGVTRIESYADDGGLGPVPWLRVYKGNALCKRLNTMHIAEIRYKED